MTQVDVYPFKKYVLALGPGRDIPPGQSIDERYWVLSPGVWQDTQAPGWCAMVNFLRPHRPTIAPEPYNSRVDPFDLDAPIRAKTSTADADVHPYMETLIRNGDAQRKVHEDLMGTIAAVDEVDWRSLRAIHLALMAEIDDCLGRMIAELKARREWENTLILFSSDHGEMMFDHHICQQASWHDQCARVPLVIHDPQCQETVAAGARIDALTEAIDLIPTLLELLGHDVPPALQGRSLAPFLRHETPTAWRDAVYWCFDYGGAVDQEYLDRFGIQRRDCLMSVIRTQTHKLAVFPGAEDVLVDLIADPHEMANLNGSKSYADVLRKKIDRKKNVVIAGTLTGLLLAMLFAFGGGGETGSFGLCVENEFQTGTTGSCATFGNEP